MQNITMLSLTDNIQIQNSDHPLIFSVQPDPEIEIMISQLSLETPWGKRSQQPKKGK